MKKQLYLTALVASMALGLIGCRDEEVSTSNCTRKAGGEYAAGKSTAETENQPDYERGKTDFNQQAAVKGKADGLAAAYQAGYNSDQGYKKGYNETYATGKTRGLNDPKAVTDGVKKGAQDGKEKGGADGDRIGGEDGAYDGDLNGKADGYEDGYDDGYYTVSLALANDDLVCEDAAGRSKKKKKAEFNEQCRKLGYTDNRDAKGSYDRGYADAKASSSVYTNAYNEWKQDSASFALGVSAGYSEGKVAGDKQGYNDGYQEKFLVGYNGIYDQAYQAEYVIAYAYAYDEWYLDRYELAYGFEYQAGYDDGYSDGYFDYCSVNASSSAGRKGGSARYKASETYLKKHRAVNFTKLAKAVEKSKGRGGPLLKRLDQARYEQAAKAWNRSTLTRGYWWLNYQSTEPNGPAYPNNKTPYADRLKAAK
jgi:hypothetical protein